MATVNKIPRRTNVVKASVKVGVTPRRIIFFSFVPPALILAWYVLELTWRP